MIPASMRRKQALSNLIGTITTYAQSARELTAELPARRVYPGHYAQTQGNYGQRDLESYLQEIDGQLDDVSRLPFRGAVVRYGWGNLNRRGATFDFEPIHRHLSRLGPGQMLIPLIEAKAFHDDYSGLAPAAIAGMLRTSDLRGNATAIMPLWEHECMDFALTTAERLAELTRIPEIAMVQFIGELAPSLHPGEGAGTNGGQPYDHEKFRDELAWFIKRVAPYYRDKALTIPINALIGGHAGILLDAAYRAGLGKHSPDLFDKGHALFAGEHGAARGYRGHMVNVAVASAPSYRNLGSAAACLDAALAARCSHVVWVTSADLPGCRLADVLRLIHTPLAEGVE